jgi:hypothetical protein
MPILNKENNTWLNARIQYEISNMSTSKLSMLDIAKKLQQEVYDKFKVEMNVFSLKDRVYKNKKRVQGALTENTLSDALYFAEIAISHLERIPQDDPYRNEAFQKIKSYIEKEK